MENIFVRLRPDCDRRTRSQLTSAAAVVSNLGSGHYANPKQTSVAIDAMSASQTGCSHSRAHSADSKMRSFLTIRLIDYLEPVNIDSFTLPRQALMPWR